MYENNGAEQEDSIRWRTLEGRAVVSSHTRRDVYFLPRKRVVAWKQRKGGEDPLFKKEEGSRNAYQHLRLLGVIFSTLI
ncbi:unnamed protein product [Victoria cruziana]